MNDYDLIRIVNKLDRTMESIRCEEDSLSTEIQNFNHAKTQIAVLEKRISELKQSKVNLEEEAKKLLGGA